MVGLAERESAVRNSDLRKRTDFINPAVEAFHKAFPSVKAWHVTAAGVAFSIAGIELAEHQNRTGRYTLKTTTLAFVSSLTGAILDLADGKLAREIRSEMGDEKARVRDEEIGQALDPLADGFTEGWQAVSSAITASKNRNPFGVNMALRRLSSVNGPRTIKAFVGCLGVSVPETYSIKDVLHGDIKFFGTSLGRKIPNCLATLINPNNIPIQAGADLIATAANGLVAADRASVLLTSVGRSLSDKEIKHARVRAVALGLETAVFMGAAYFVGNRLQSKGK